MKLGLALKQTEYDFGSDERLRVYLTNTLQPAEEIPRTDTPFLAHEADEANTVKTETPIRVVIGNPPYAGHSANASKNPDGTPNFIGRLLRDYYFVDGKPLGEKNPKWLQDDYVKFIRWAQWRIEQTGAGILAMITNHGYLDNPTFRGMRQRLMRTFSDIYVLDLHGSLKKRKVAPDGSKDENVFDIEPGVAICLMVRKGGASDKASNFHADSYGTREYKSNWLMTVHADMRRIDWTPVEPRSPFYLFVPRGTGDLKKTVGPEGIFHYMYAVFHSPTYRERYAEFLKIDFPRLPLTRSLEMFRALAAKGAELVALHLMESPMLDKPITHLVTPSPGHPVTVGKGFPKYHDDTVWVNAEQGFVGVPEDVWEFHIGGYQVCHKWLKDRRGRTLLKEDIAHYQRIVVALKETIRLMSEIDDVIPGWPME